MYGYKIMAEKTQLAGFSDVAFLFAGAYHLLQHEVDCHSYLQETSEIRREVYTKTQEFFIMMHEAAHGLLAIDLQFRSKHFAFVTDILRKMMPDAEEAAESATSEVLTKFDNKHTEVRGHQAESLSEFSNTASPYCICLRRRLRTDHPAVSRGTGEQGG